jgi:hypothetical protein
VNIHIALGKAAMLIFSIAVIPASSAEPAASTTRECATPEPPVAEITRASNAARQFDANSAVLRVERVKFQVPVAFHVIHSQGEGNVTNQQLDAQLRVLDQQLGPFGYKFVRHSVSRTDNAAWQSMISGEQTETDAKHALTIDHASVLNFYVAKPRYWTKDAAGNRVVSNALGIATFPWWLGEATWDSKLDGVVIDYRTLPSVKSWEFDLGYTAVHEVGHWVGLLHTFQGGGALSQSFQNGCAPPGDEVGDTPDEYGPYFGPGLGKQCVAPMPSRCLAGGLNPIRNYMDYADDRCMSELTVGQDLRARSMMQSYRASFVDRSPEVRRFNQMKLGR